VNKPVPTTNRASTGWICLLLVGLTFLVFGPVSGHEFNHYDDPSYVTANKVIQAGLTPEGLAWAFGRLHGPDTYWHPLTWVSHMVDCQIFGLNAGVHHVINVAFHSLNGALLFLLLFRMTGSTWRSAMVASLFAVHPLQVETVAWVAERKNVLSGTFWWLSLLTYVGYAQRGGSGRYLLSVLLFALGLMSKPSLVTLPAVLLLLDYWPLGRLTLSGAKPGGSSAQFRVAPIRQILLEKLPFLALSAVSSVITVLAHQGLAATQAPLGVPLALRLQNAVVSYGRYLGKFFWPTDLAVLYPYPDAWSLAAVGWSAAVLVGFTVAVLRNVRRHPGPAVGWFWFLGVLVPTIGLVEAGIQAMADRFMYLPIVGLLIATVWGMADWLLGWKRRRPVLAVLGAGALAGCVAVTSVQLTHWRDSLALFRHATRVTQNNFALHYNLGVLLLAAGREEAAVQEVQSALTIRPQLAEGHQFLGSLAARHQRFDEAIQHYRRANELSPNWPQPLAAQAQAEAQMGRSAAAVATYQRLLKLAPEDHVARIRLGSLLLQQQPAEAVAVWRDALRLQPDNPELLNNLAWVLATSPVAGVRNGAEAVRHAERACALTQHRQAMLVGTLAAAYAEAGEFNQAVAAAEKAQSLARVAGDEKLAARNGELRELYRAGRAYREEPARP